MEESREEDEVARVRMPIMWPKEIREKNRATEINPKILGFIFSSGLQLLLYGLQLVINILMEVHYCVDEVGGDFHERRKTCVKMRKERFSINGLICGLEEEYFGLWVESNGSVWSAEFYFLKLKKISFSNLMRI